MAKSSSLLEDEEVICRGPEDLILTSDGWIGQFSTHRYEGITQIFRMLHVRDITSIYFSKKTTVQKVFHMLLVSSLIVSTVLLFLYPISFGTDVFLNGFDIDRCQNVGTENWSCEQSSDSWLPFSTESLILLVSSPFLLAILSNSEKTDPKSVLIIQHKNGTMAQKQSGSGLWWIWGSSIAWMMFSSPSPGAGITTHLDVFFVGVLAILGYFILQFVKIEFSLDSNSN